MRKLLAFMGLVLALALLTINLPHILNANANQTEKVDIYDQQKQLVKSVVFVIGMNEYFVNNQTPGVKMDAKPFVERGRTFVPVRYLSNALGVTDKHIGWEEKAKLVTLKQPGFSVVELVIGKRQLKSDGKSTIMDVSPLAKKGRTYLPARFVAEALGYQVDWDSQLNIVVCWPKGEPKPDISAVKAELQNNSTSKVDLSKVMPFREDGTMASLGYGDDPDWEYLMGTWVPGENPEEVYLMYITLDEINSSNGVRVGNNVVFRVDYNPNDTMNGHPRFSIAIDQYDLGYRPEVGASAVSVSGLLKGDKVLTRIGGGGDLVGFDGDRSRIRPDERFTETYGKIDRWGDMGLSETTHIVISECSATSMDGRYSLIVEL